MLCRCSPAPQAPPQPGHAVPGTSTSSEPLSSLGEAHGSPLPSLLGEPSFSFHVVWRSLLAPGSWQDIARSWTIRTGQALGTVQALGQARCPDLAHQCQGDQLLGPRLHQPRKALLCRGPGRSGSGVLQTEPVRVKEKEGGASTAALNIWIQLFLNRP